VVAAFLSMGRSEAREEIKLVLTDSLASRLGPDQTNGRKIKVSLLYG
jgi:hypothetical protein